VQRGSCDLEVVTHHEDINRPGASALKSEVYPPTALALMP
jgi:hypothetical protein